MGYFDIIKRGITVTNRNLLALLVQFLQWVVIFVLVIALAAGVYVFAAGMDFSNFSTLSPETIVNAIGSSIALIVTAALGLILLMAVVYLLSSMVQAGVLGCIIETAEERAKGFTTGTFFSCAARSGISLMWYSILLTVIVFAAFTVFALGGAVTYFMAVKPLVDAGHTVAGYGILVLALIVVFCVLLVVMFLSYAGGVVGMVSLVRERTGAIAALRHAYRFVNEKFWDSMLFALLLIFIMVAISMSTALLIMPVQMAVSVWGGALLGVYIILRLLDMVFQAYVGLCLLSCFTVFYLDRTAPPAPVYADPVIAEWRPEPI